MKGLCLAASILAAGLARAGADSPAHRQIKFNPVPARIDLAAARTAVVVIDMQNDFCSDGGLLDRMRMDLSEIKRTIAPTARVLAAARQAGLPIIYLQMAFKPDLSDAGPKGSPNREGHLHAGAGSPVVAPDGSASRILIRDTWDTAVVDALKPAPGDITIYKTRFDGFYQTNLDSTLKKLGVTQLVVVGLTTSTCVESTIRDAMFHDYSCVLLADCTAEPLGAELPYTNYAATLFVVQARFGAVSNSAEFQEAVRRRLGPGPDH
jgi:ureidoacrylate peracid hydrolase